MNITIVSQTGQEVNNVQGKDLFIKKMLIDGEEKYCICTKCPPPSVALDVILGAYDTMERALYLRGRLCEEISFARDTKAIDCKMGLPPE